MNLTPDYVAQALVELLDVPTAPFFESRVAGVLARRLRGIGCALTRDPYGNLIARLGDPSRPSIAYVAHMDHPGFEVLDAKGAMAAGATWGGSNAVRAIFAQPVRVRLHAALADGDDAPLFATGRDWSDGRFTLDLSTPAPGARTPRFGIWDLPPARIDDAGFVHARACDDLAGCAAIVLALEDIADQPPDACVYGVFTRCEEIGLVGATFIARERAIPPHATVVSVECSRAVPPVELGCGAVLRVGDRGTGFDYRAEAVLRAVLEEMHDEGIGMQRALLSGGTCEARVFMSEGYATTGLSIPLRNYHNLADDGPSPKPEIVHLDDVVSAAEALSRAPRHVGTDAFGAVTARIYERADGHAERLRASFAEWPGAES